MNQFKRAKVVILPTDKPTQVGICIKNMYDRKIGDIEFFNSYLFMSLDYWKPQHLYIVSNDEIKEGDWVLNIASSANKPIQIDKEGVNFLKERKTPTKKIIATTDTSLKIDISSKGQKEAYIQELSILPQPSYQFIKKYIESYNKGKIINDVLVEYEESVTIVDEIQWNHFNTIKVNSKDNTITIKKLKNSWNREEHISNLNKYRKDYEHFKRTCHSGPNQLEITRWTEQWIKENL